jgi:hypothetical protein
MLIDAGAMGGFAPLAAHPGRLPPRAQPDCEATGRWVF